MIVERPARAAAWCPRSRRACTALRGGVGRAHILNGTVPHALLLEVYTDEGVGTMITDPREEA